MAEDSLSFRFDDEIAAETEEPAGGDQKLHAHMPVFGAHILHETTAPSEHRDYGAACFLRGIDEHMFDGFVPLSINLAEDDFRTGNLKLESFAAHRFDKHGKM